GVDAKGDVLDQLRRISTFRIAALQRELGISRRAFPLVGDEVVLPSDPMAALAGRTDIDIMIGTTSEEDRLFAVTGWAPPARGLGPTIARYLRDADARAEAEALYARALGERGGDEVAVTHLIATEHGWAEPARRLAAVHSGAGGRTYLYEFEWASSALDGRVGAAHLVDLPFFFDNLDAPGVDELLGEAGRQEPARRLAHDLSGAVAAFARSGDPSGPLGPWPAFTPTERATQVLGATSRVEVDRLADRLDFWTRNRGRSAPALSTLSEG
ncbi:MAG: carboxylesterase family protein, partial [Hyphomicrobiales bacterium]|nr:carboxylesterase family protein [Hyphomicrobiales bacterium]